MLPAPIPKNDEERLRALHALKLLDTAPEERFDAITREAMKSFNVAFSSISLIDAKREWFKSQQGLGVQEGRRADSFCGHALLSKYIFVVDDTLKDPRFADNPNVVGPPFIRFYAGVALRENETHEPIGVLCIKDTKPRQFTHAELGVLLNLAAKAELELNKKPLGKSNA